MTVQDLLNITPVKEGGPETRLIVDGKCGPLLVSAIRTFQKAKGLLVDGRVDPNGPTLKALIAPALTYQWSTEVKPLGGFVLSPGETARLKEEYASAQYSKRTRLAQILNAIDQWLLGSATQSVGTNIWGKQSGEGSTATKLAPGGKMRGNFDFKEFSELMEEILGFMPGVHPSDYRAAAKGKFKTFPRRSCRIPA
jgi:peptidoglycan hydrolase-like protein with peptidoglycan-binding domain